MIDNAVALALFAIVNYVVLGSEMATSVPLPDMLSVTWRLNKWPSNFQSAFWPLFDLVMTLTFDLKSNQLIFVPNCTSIVNLVNTTNNSLYPFIRRRTAIICITTADTQDRRTRLYAPFETISLKVWYGLHFWETVLCFRGCHSALSCVSHHVCLHINLSCVFCTDKAVHY